MTDNLRSELDRRHEASRRLPALDHLGYSDPDNPPHERIYSKNEYRYLWTTAHTEGERAELQRLASTAPETTVM